MPSASANRKFIWLAAASVIGFIALIAAWFLLPMDEWLHHFSRWAQGLGTTGVVIVSIGYVVCTLLLVPGVALTLAVAVAYGWWALTICFLGGMTAALISFLVSRYLAREGVKRFLDRHPTMKAVDTVAYEESFKTIVLARLTPVTPFAVENYAFGVTGVRLGSFLLATAIGIVPGTIQNVWIGVIGRTAAEGGAGVMNWILLAVGLMATIVLTVWMTRQAKSRMKQQAEPALQTS
ncbi:TVP38/TMEM64 family protein [Microvirga terrestris]|uniref:TVP38/TMEM64 family membrane protein n=1 Tax=Microvirga terrestris TaxID=2791024 RepID=A0ABS0HVU6_9HYPH|nr:TVP38/TMEM64 family protein [Microvirga terrestris]MBF9197603.1 TVP38/TMEM64 family protein [Microvirga terrestris]